MICCTIIALLFGSVIWAFRKLPFVGHLGPSDPLAWSLADVDTNGQGTQPFSLRVRAQSFRYAYNGVKVVLCGEHSAWIHLFVAAVAIALGLYLNIDLEAWRWIILCIGLVIFSEILNTAIEAVCDVVSPQYNAVIGLAKDMGAGAVLLVCKIAFRL